MDLTSGETIEERRIDEKTRSYGEGDGERTEVRDGWGKRNDKDSQYSEPVVPFLSPYPLPFLPCQTKHHFVCPQFMLTNVCTCPQMATCRRQATAADPPAGERRRTAGIRSSAPAQTDRTDRNSDDLEDG